jgi:hypothetical protein
VQKARTLKKVSFRPKGDFAPIDKLLREDELESLEHAIRVVEELDELSAITNVVYGTMPLMNAEMDSELDICTTAVWHAEIYRYFDNTWNVSPKWRIRKSIREVDACVALMKNGSYPRELLSNDNTAPITEDEALEVLDSFIKNINEKDRYLFGDSAQQKSTQKHKKKKSTRQKSEN